jgi:hypothetical protein
MVFIKSFLKFLSFFLTFILKKTGDGLRVVFRIYFLVEGWIGILLVVLFQLLGQIIFFLLKKVTVGLSFIFRKIFLYFYNTELFEKLRILLQIIFAVIGPFVRRIVLAYLFFNICIFYMLVLLFLLCLMFFSLPWEKIGHYMIHHPAVSLGRLKELGVVAKAKIAAFFNMPPDIMTLPGIDIWKEHSVLCFMSYSLYILTVLAFFVSWGVISQSKMQLVANFLYQEVYPKYMDFVHSNYIGRYMHFVHDYFFIFIDSRFLIPRYRPDLDIYYRGDFIYYFLINLEDPYVMQFIPAFCLWIFVVSIVLCLPYETGFFIYFLLLRVVHVSMFYYLRHIFLPMFSMSAIRKDFRKVKIELSILVKEWNTYPPFFGELYVLTSMAFFFFIGLAVLFL